MTVRAHRNDRLPGRLKPLVWILDHCFFYVLIAFQVTTVAVGGGCTLLQWAVGSAVAVDGGCTLLQWAVGSAVAVGGR